MKYADRGYEIRLPQSYHPFKIDPFLWSRKINEINGLDKLLQRD